MSFQNLESTLVKTLQEVLSNFSSIEDIQVKHVSHINYAAYITVHELNYIADMLSIDRIDNFVKAEFYSKLPAGMWINMKVYVYPINITFDLIQ